MLSSITLDDEATAEIRAKHFAGVQSAELKHSRLAKRPNGRKRIVDFVRDLASKNSAASVPVATAFAAHKRFQLLTLITDLWVEPAMHEDGIDMYERGGNVAFSNMSFYVLGLAPQFLDQLLKLFEPMMRLRTREAYESFWDFVYHKFHNPVEISPDPQVQKMIRDTIVCFMGGQDRLGPTHLLGLPEHCLDVAFSTVAITAHHWQNRISEPLRFVLDESKYLTQSKWIWEEVTRRDMPKATFHGSANVRIEFPLNIEGTTTADSKLVHQLQLADLVAGAVCERLLEVEYRGCECGERPMKIERLEELQQSIDALQSIKVPALAARFRCAASR